MYASLFSTSELTKKVSCFGSNPNNEITSLYVKAKANVISNNPYNASKKLPNSLLKTQYTIYLAV